MCEIQAINRANLTNPSGPLAVTMPIHILPTEIGAPLQYNVHPIQSDTTVGNIANTHQAPSHTSRWLVKFDESGNWAIRVVKKKKQ